MRARGGTCQCLCNCVTSHHFNPSQQEGTTRLHTSYTKLHSSLLCNPVIVDDEDENVGRCSSIYHRKSTGQWGKGAGEPRLSGRFGPTETRQGDKDPNGPCPSGGVPGNRKRRTPPTPTGASAACPGDEHIRRPDAGGHHPRPRPVDGVALPPPVVAGHGTEWQPHASSRQWAGDGPRSTRPRSHRGNA